MTRKPVGRLRLATQTLHRLDAGALREAVGASVIYYASAVCPTAICIRSLTDPSIGLGGSAATARNCPLTAWICRP